MTNSEQKSKEPRVLNESRREFLRNSAVVTAGAMAMGLTAGLEKRGWTIVLRVAASWIAAVGLLMLGWEVRGVIS